MFYAYTYVYVYMYAGGSDRVPADPKQSTYVLT